MQTTIARPIAPPSPDPETVQRLVTRRLVLRYALTPPVAAAIAALAGIGPDSGRRA